MASTFYQAKYETALTALVRIEALPSEGDPETGESLQDIAREAMEVLGVAVCRACEEVYDEGTGEGYCGLCPSCADASEPVESLFEEQYENAQFAGDEEQFGASSGYDDWGED